MIKENLIRKMIDNNAVIALENFYQFWDICREFRHGYSYSYNVSNLNKKDYDTIAEKEEFVYLCLDSVNNTTVATLKDKNSLYENTEILSFENFYDKKILEKYHLKVDTPFYIIGKGDNLYICTLDGNIFFTGNIDSDENIDKEFPPLSTVFDILNGNIKTRVNAKPILGKKYYYVEYPITEDMKLNKDNFKICKSVFENYSDLLRWKAGNFFYSLEDVNAFVTK